MGRLIFVIEQKGLLNYLGGGGALQMWALHCVNPGLHKYTHKPLFFIIFLQTGRLDVTAKDAYEHI